jgi:hypothetical protein
MGLGTEIQHRGFRRLIASIAAEIFIAARRQDFCPAGQKHRGSWTMTPIGLFESMAPQSSCRLTDG